MHVTARWRAAARGPPAAAGRDGPGPCARGMRNRGRGGTACRGRAGAARALGGNRPPLVLGLMGRPSPERAQGASGGGAPAVQRIFANVGKRIPLGARFAGSCAWAALDTPGHAHVRRSDACTGCAQRCAQLRSSGRMGGSWCEGDQAARGPHVHAQPPDAAWERHGSPCRPFEGACSGRTGCPRRATALQTCLCVLPAAFALSIPARARHSLTALRRFATGHHAPSLVPQHAPRVRASYCMSLEPASLGTFCRP